jgi:transposase-like protein
MPTPRSPFNRPRWTETDARAALAALRDSGQPVSLFAAAHGLDPQRLYVWRRRFAKTSAVRPFEEIVVRQSHDSRSTPVAREGFTILLSSGHTLRVPTAFDVEDLRRLVDVLAETSVC